MPYCLPGRLRPPRPAGDYFRRRPVGHAGRHQPAAHRLCRRRLRGFVTRLAPRPGLSHPSTRQLDVLALDLALEKLDRMARVVEEWIDLERLAIGLQRLLLGAERFEHHTEIVYRLVVLGIDVERVPEIG